MRLHGNAALSLSGRRLVAERVVDQGVDAEAGGRGRRHQRPLRPQVGGPVRSEGEQGLGSLLGSAPRRNRTAPERVAMIVSLRRLRMTAAEIAETLEMPLSTVSAVLKRKGWAGLAGSVSSSPSVTSAPGRGARPSTSRSSAGSRAARPPRHRRRTPAATATYTAADGHRRGRKGWEYVHVAVDDYSRLAYAEVLADEKQRPLLAFSVAQSPTTTGTASGSSGSSPTTAPATERPSTRSPAERSASNTAAPDLPTPDQRKSRTLHPHPSRRMGVRRRLPHKRRTHRRS